MAIGYLEMPNYLRLIKQMLTKDSLIHTDYQNANFITKIDTNIFLKLTILQLCQKRAQIFISKYFSSPKNKIKSNRET